MAELYPIIPAADPAAHVVFVHGLDGDPFATWNFGSTNSWREWLQADRQDFSVWTLGYDAASSRWRGAAMPLVDRAVNVLALLDTYQLDEKPIFLICHSMGGLLAKQILREALSNSPEYRRLASAVRGVVFLSTPHTGADIASLIAYLQFFLRGTVALDELKAHAPALRELNRWFRNHVGELPIAVKVLVETRSTKGVMVVSASNADPGLTGVTPIPVDADHISICKPTSREHIVYRTVRRFLDEQRPSSGGDPVLARIRRNVLVAHDLRDLRRQRAELESYLADRPPSAEASVVKHMIDEAIEREPMIAAAPAPAPSLRISHGRAYRFSPLMAIISMLTLFFIVAGGIGGFVSIVRWLIDFFR